MTELQAAIHEFFSQFSKAYPEPILVTKGTVFPYIVYDYRMSEAMTSSLCTFQIWDKANHIQRINDIADKIVQSVPIITGVIVEVNSSGYLKIMRGVPFIRSMPVNPNELDIVRYMGNLEIKHLI